MKQMAYYLVRCLNLKDGASEETGDIYVYGLTILLEVLVYIGITLFAAFGMGMVKELLTIYILVFLIRSYGGGFHFENYRWCLAVSCIFIVFILWLYKYDVLPLPVQVVTCHIFILYMYFKGVTKEPGRNYSNKEITHYNKCTKVILKLVYIALFIIAKGRGMQSVSLLMITIIMLGISKVFGEFRYHRYLRSQRNVEDSI